MPFRDRTDAGRQLSERLARARIGPGADEGAGAGAGTSDVVVLALPRGSVPVAAPVAQAWGVPVVPFVARKIGAPGQPELGIGAVAEGSDTVLVAAHAARLGLRPADVADLARHERDEVARRVEQYRHGHPLPPLAGRDVVVVDDGLATGVTAEVAVRALREQRPRRLVLAVPVCASDTVQRLAPLVDDLVCVHCPDDFRAVGAWYAAFEQTSDEEVLRIVDAPPPSHTGPSHTGPAHAGAVTERDVTLRMADGSDLQATLTVPDHARAVVLFAHGSGSSRHSLRNRAVARRLHDDGVATLLMDLLTDDEREQDRATSGHRFDGGHRFDIVLLGGRVLAGTTWLRSEPSTRDLPIGYAGASTGAAAALFAAAADEHGVDAVVSRGGRPDLAGELLVAVTAPTLLIVGGDDAEVLRLNRSAMDRLPHSELSLVPGASHLFEEEGALARAGELTAAWFHEHLAAS